MTMNTESGAIGLPAGTKESGTRVDFNPNDFDIAIETKSYRVAWSRAAWCPCIPVNDQTKQSDPNCTLCQGSGWFYFSPSKATTDETKVGKLDNVQTRIVSDKAAVIYALMTGISTQYNPYDPLGSRITGMVNVSVRRENKVGYYDKITNLDSVIVYSELLTAGVPTSPLKTRYPIVQVNLLRSFTAEFQGVETPTASSGDFSLDSNGFIVWNQLNPSANIPTEGEVVVIHYLCHPQWLIIDYPHSLRTTPLKFKRNKPRAPAGDAIELPIQAKAQLEFLPRLQEQ